MLDFFDSAEPGAAVQPAESVIITNDIEVPETIQAESIAEDYIFLTSPIDDLEPVTILVALIVVILIFQTIVRAFKGNS